MIARTRPLISTAQAQPRRPRELCNRRRLAITLGLAFVAGGPAFGAGAGFHKLTGPQIRATIIGKAVTDDVHWIEEFRGRGVLYEMGMGRKSIGAWRISQDRLCTVTRLDGDVCYQVWVHGSAVQFRLTEDITRYGGRLQPIRPKG